MSIARTMTFTLVAFIAASVIAPSPTMSASAGTGVSIKQVRPASGDATSMTTTTKPAAKVLSLTDTSTPDVEPAMRDLIDRARNLDSARADWRADKQLTEELCNLLARGGPDAQRLIFEYYRVFKERSAAIMLAALATHYEKNELHPAACQAAANAASFIITAAARLGFDPNSSAHIVLSRMAQRPELMQHISEEMRRHGCDPTQVANVFKGGGSGDDTELALRMREWVVTPSLPMPTRVDALHTLATLEGEQALEALIDIADGSDPAVEGAERAPATNTRRTPIDIDNDNLRQLRESAMAALVNRRFNNRRDAKATAELERRLIPVFGKIIRSTQQRSLLDRAISSLSELGNDGKVALIDLYEKETHGTRAQAMADKIAGYADYPRTLVLDSNQTGGAKGEAFRAAAVRIMRLGMQPPPQRRTEFLRITDDAQANAELRRQATIAVLEKAGMRSTVPNREIQRLLGSPYPEVADAATRLLARELDARMFTPETVRPLFHSPVRGQREMAIRQTFAPHLRGQLTPDVVLPLLQSEYLDVAQAAARALYADDALRRSVGIDSARRIGQLTGIQTVDDITHPLTPRATWSTEISRVPAAGTSTVPSSQARSGDATSWLWDLTLWPAGLLIAGVAMIYLFAMLTVPEPRIAITPPDA